MSLTTLRPQTPAFPRPINPYRPPEPHAVIEKVDAGSIGAEIGLAPGDEILRINGEKMEDVIDYRFLIAEEVVELEIAPGAVVANAYTVTVEKEIDETLGVTFRADVFDGIRICTNNCDFCFVYQNRRRMRKSVYVKDDDYRLSFLHGDFITLTNLTESCWERIFRYQLSPLYVSVHATDPDARVAMLRNPDGALLSQHLERLFRGGIEIHAQVVYTPGINDGPILDRTVADLAGYCGGPTGGGCRSLAIVPVGLTTFRTNLPALRTVSREEAREVVDKAAVWQRDLRRSLGTRFVFPSDEFYLLAERPLPGLRTYEDLAQVENGVGMIPRFRADWARLMRRASGGPKVRRAVVATGALAAPVLRELLSQIDPEAEVDVVPIRNGFFGESVTVAGLLTGTDLAEQLGPRLAARPAETVLIPSVAVRDDRFMDDWTLAEVAESLGTRIEVIPATARGLLAGVRAA